MRMKSLILLAKVRAQLAKGNHFIGVGTIMTLPRLLGSEWPNLAAIKTTVYNCNCRWVVAANM